MSKVILKLVCTLMYSYGFKEHYKKREYLLLEQQHFSQEFSSFLVETA